MLPRPKLIVWVPAAVVYITFPFWLSSKSTLMVFIPLGFSSHIYSVWLILSCIGDDMSPGSAITLLELIYSSSESAGVS